MNDNTPSPAEVVRLHSHDKRIDALAQALMDTITERGDGLALVAVLGTLRLLEGYVIRQYSNLGD